MLFNVIPFSLLPYYFFTFLPFYFFTLLPFYPFTFLFLYFFTFLPFYLFTFFTLLEVPPSKVVFSIYKPLSTFLISVPSREYSLRDVALVASEEPLLTICSIPSAFFLLLKRNNFTPWLGNDVEISPFTGASSFLSQMSYTDTSSSA